MILSVSFTGHRYIKEYKVVKNYLENYLRKLITDNKDKEIVFYSGAAKGFDQIAFFAINMIKKEIKQKGENINIKNIVASPIKNFSVPNYGILKKLADEFIIVEELENYKTDNFMEKFQKRNEFMVDNSTLLISFYDGRQGGGTLNTVNYAKKNNREIIYLKEMIDNDKN